MNYQTSEESLSIMALISEESLEPLLQSVRSTMISMLRQELTLIKISLTASPAVKVGTPYKSLPQGKE